VRSASLVALVGRSPKRWMHTLRRLLCAARHARRIGMLDLRELTAAARRAGRAPQRRARRRARQRRRRRRLDLSTAQFGNAEPDKSLTSPDELAQVTTCLEVPGNMSGIAHDVGFVGPLTRCRSGLTGMVATWVATGLAELGPGHPSATCLLNSCQGRRQAWLCVYMYRAPLRFAVAPRSQSGLTANLQPS
jgi:hypothetical protein